MLFLSCLVWFGLGSSCLVLSRLVSSCPVSSCWSVCCCPRCLHATAVSRLGVCFGMAECQMSKTKKKQKKEKKRKQKKNGRDPRTHYSYSTLPLHGSLCSYLMSEKGETLADFAQCLFCAMPGVMGYKLWQGSEDSNVLRIYKAVPCDSQQSP